MKIYKITESYTGYVDYVINANSEKEAMKLYNDDINFGTNNCTEINNDSLYKDDFNFSSIEEYDCPIIESLMETL